MPGFPFVKQLDAMDCGPSCLKMIASYYGKHYSLDRLRSLSYISREGVSFLGLSEAADAISLNATGARLSLSQLKAEVKLPCILHWRQKHFVVLYKITKKYFYIADPAFGKIKYTRDEFIRQWLSTKKSGEEKGLCLILEPRPEFYEKSGDKRTKGSFKFLAAYLKPYKKLILQLFVGMLAGSLLLLIFPFLTQSVVDIGINTKDIDFIVLVLIAQLVLYFGKATVDFIRSWILLHITSRVSISLISDFLSKLMRLPMNFFDTKLTGDILQRIGDHERVESFLATSTLNTLFSVFNFLIFSVVLAIYHWGILLIFIAGSVLYLLWINLFMKKRREIDRKRFAKKAEHQNSIIQMVNGIQEIKINNSEMLKKWEWERIQATLFKLRVKSLSINQYQQAGSVFINELKNIIISFLAAKAVVDGSMSLGALVAIQYIIGQMNSPLTQMIGFMQKSQDAKISLERLEEIHQREDEESAMDENISTLDPKADFSIRNLSFQYQGPRSPRVLKDIDLEIPNAKLTAIVGASGSGKTTLIKLLLGFYQPVAGKILLGDRSLQDYNKRFLRSKIGVVNQNGFIFSDSLAKNIAFGEEKIDKGKLAYAAQIANISEWIESLPLGYNTKIGADGQDLSQGQKQRILIARAVYKNPDILFFDEATNSLDANNEKCIMENLEPFYQNKTVVVVAHRLSTVRNADQILVLDNGILVEKGNHDELVAKKGAYYNLVKNQLELGD